MAIACTNLTNVVRLVHLLRIDGYGITKAIGSDRWIKSRWNVGGYEWGVNFHPSRSNTAVDCKPWVTLRLIFLSDGCTTPNVEASMRCRLVDPRGTADPSEEKSITCRFNSRPKGQLGASGDCSNPVYLMSAWELEASCYLKDDSLTVQCTVTVLKELVEVTIQDHEPMPVVPSTRLHQHLGELLQSGTAADVEFIVSGESLVAHKNIFVRVMAARSPVLMAEFFGHMREASSRVTVIEDMEAAAFKAMLHFIYTDAVPAEFDGQGEGEAATSMAQHLLVAADRYGLERLKLICENKLFSCITANTAVAILVLADQHNCSQLKAKCAEFLFNTLPRC
ncbi:BTB/POZ and MATH domain-containing protein 1-like [Triticum dicoccoides]|uniref:BTB/POZ and MATH domain-containing protein 1-like n=1 Tax=Triticum dicoccoides TaxID=85692 RepID=UPI0018918ED6|nr:BTB/POZ and MATH domain-containing protein 1-like [Triticum dicoccoides]